MEEGTDIINVNGILNMYREDCADMSYPFNKEDYKEFIKYLEIDFYDWVKENLRYYHDKK